MSGLRKPFSDAVDRNLAEWIAGKLPPLEVQHPGSGRAWLALTDGATVRENSLRSFGRLAHWSSQFIQPTGHGASADESSADESSVEELLKRFEPRLGSDRFTGWWAREAQIYVFGREFVTRADDIDDRMFEGICRRLDRNSATLDALEEEFVRRISRG